MTDSKLGKGNVKKLLISMAIPSVVGQIVSLVYNLVDRIFIGHIPEVGGLALTGVGVTAPLVTLITAFSALIGAGGGPLSSIRLGQGKKDEGEEIMGSCFSALLILSLILMLTLGIFLEDLLLIFGASENTIVYALDYMKIYLLGTPFVFISLGMNYFIIAQGYSKTSMATVSIGAILNIILDPIFIFKLNLGVSGAALATIISQGVSAFWVLRFLIKSRGIMNLKKNKLRPKKKALAECIKLGASPFVMISTESLLIISFNRSLLKFGGDVAVGMMTILSSCMQMATLPMTGITQGAQPIISYNYGAKNYSRMRECFSFELKIISAYATLIWAIMLVIPGFFAQIFTSEPQIIQATTNGLRIYMAGVFMLGIQFACQQTFVAMGNAKTSLFLAVLRKIILLIPLIYILPNFFENKVFAVLLAEPIADIIAAITTGTLFYKSYKDIYFIKDKKPW